MKRKEIQLGEALLALLPFLIFILIALALRSDFPNFWSIVHLLALPPFSSDLTSIGGSPAFDDRELAACPGVRFAVERASWHGPARGRMRPYIVDFEDEESATGDCAGVPFADTFAAFASAFASNDFLKNGSCCGIDLSELPGVLRAVCLELDTRRKGGLLPSCSSPKVTRRVSDA